MTPEGRVKNDVKKILDGYSNVFYFMPVMVGYNSSGVHDIIVCVAGKFLSIECKADEKKDMTPLQTRFALDVSEADGMTFVACDTNLDVLTTYLIFLGAIRK